MAHAQMELWQTMPRQALSVGDTVRYANREHRIAAINKMTVLIQEGENHPFAIHPSKIGCILQDKPMPAPTAEPLAPSKPKYERKVKKAPTTVLKKLLETYNRQELAERLGVTDSGIGGWLAAGEMSAIAALACEGLLSQSAKRVVSRLLITQTPHGVSVENLANADTCEINGNKYYLIPVPKGG